MYPGFDQTTLLVGYRKKAIPVNLAFTAEQSTVEDNPSTKPAELKTLEKTETTTTADTSTKTSETVTPSDILLPTTTTSTVITSDTPSAAVTSTSSIVHVNTLPGNDHLYFDQQHHPVMYTHIDPQKQQLQVEDNSSYRSYDPNNVISSSSIALPPDAIIDHLELDAAGDHLADFLLPGPADFLINQVTLWIYVFICFFHNLNVKDKGEQISLLTF